MESWAWITIVSISVLLLINWLIVMGCDPRKWKGGKKNGER